MWTTRLPPIQPVSPAKLWAKILVDTLGSSASDYTYVDFCAGAGGPTPSLEQAINSQLTGSTSSTSGKRPVDFVLTDRSPHTAAWKLASARSPHVHYVPTSVDAARAPANLLAKAGLDTGRRILRTFHMSFHHFDDAAAVAILRDTFRSADGIAVVELVERRLLSVVVFNLLMPVPVLVLPALLFWNDPTTLFFTYVLPVLPLVTLFDGLVSCLRCRSEREFLALVEKAQVHGELEGWEWTCGRVRHSWPMGYLNYFIGQKKRKTD